MYALTCITPYAYKELAAGGIKTLELRSAHNINAIARAKVDDHVFITCKTDEDVTKETKGIIARIRSISMQKSRQSMEYDEYEVITSRIQLEYLDSAKIKDIAASRLGSEVSVDIEKVTYYRIS